MSISSYSLSPFLKWKQMGEDISVYIEDIISSLGDETKRDALEKEFKKFLEYGVPPDYAKKILMGKFAKSKKRKRLLELEGRETNVNLLCRVITLNEKEVVAKGKTKKILYGLIGDESGVLPFTSWNPSISLEKGEVIEVKNAYTREWQGGIQVNFGDRTVIERVEEEKLPLVSYEPKKCKIADIYNVYGPIEIVVKVLDVSKREVEVNGEKKVVFSGTVGDETGKAQYTAWHDFNLKEGEVVKITGGYARFWKGIPQIVFDERSKVERIKREMIVSSGKMPLHKLVEMRGGIDIIVEGTVIEIKGGSGYIERCPKCKRPVSKGECKIHGKVEAIPDLRIKMVVDDGSAAIGAIVGKELTKKLIGVGIEECRRMGADETRHLLEKTLLTRKILLKGNAIGDEFGTTLIAKGAEIIDEDVKEKALDLLERLREI